MTGPLTEGSTRGGNGAVKTQNNEIEQLKKDIAFLQEQLWFTQEAMRKLMIELTNNLGSIGAEEIKTLLTEWTQIVHNINNEYVQNQKD